ncbi:hypothetical protein [Stakelama marina]|uniref:Uncharacterized protein n=1 Tax=Stakelama marina TaxID=2826939 RepID=A0A8T4IGW8_9SPHN|nr:hypothetical protein [Stakelama marina]MBR0553741.1 hypothetical protein [Stakelama marina]
MSNQTNIEALDLPMSAVAPVRLGKNADEKSCGLFLPYRSNLPMGLVVDWDDQKHMIHLDGSYAFKEAAVGAGNPIRGVIVSQVEYRVDATSRYNSEEEFDPAGALVLRSGQLFISCRRLGDQFHDDPYRVPLMKGFAEGSADEACGFTRWSIAVRESGDVKVIRSFEAQPKT